MHLNFPIELIKEAFSDHDNYWYYDHISPSNASSVAFRLINGSYELSEISDREGVEYLLGSAIPCSVDINTATTDELRICEKVPWVSKYMVPNHEEALFMATMPELVDKGIISQDDVDTLERLKNLDTLKEEDYAALIELRLTLHVYKYYIHITGHKHISSGDSTIPFKITSADISFTGNRLMGI